MTDVIRRKIDRAQPALSEGAPGADRGWRLALARATRDAMGLDLEVRQLSIKRQSLTEIMEQVPDRALLALLDGPEDGLGVIMLSSSVTASLIEMQTLGRLSLQVPPPRKSSRIDAAMVVGLIDRALAGLDETLVEEADLTWAGGFRYASYLEDVRPLGLMLEEDAYRVLSATVVMGGANAREGQVLLVLPANGRGIWSGQGRSESETEAPHFTAALGAQVLQADSRLDAVIGRISLPIGRIMAMVPGETLELHGVALDTIALETTDGVRLAQARLGQYRGMRALKLSETVGLRASGGGSVAARLAQAAQVPTVEPPASLEAPNPELRATG